MNPQKIEKLKQLLFEAEAKFLLVRQIEVDAIAPALDYSKPEDQEFAAFVCAVLAYGKVEHIKKSSRKLLAPLGKNPVQFLKTADVQAFAKHTDGWKHRFNTAVDARHLLLLLKSIYEREGSIEVFMTKDSNVENIKDLLEAFVSKVEVRLKELRLKPSKSFWFFLPKPSSGSACKRLNLYLRWMAGRGHFDLKLWTKIPESLLMIPLDVHLLNQARSLRMTRRKQADWKTVEEVTSKLRLLDSTNPTRFDFALCHLGITGKILASLLAIFIFIGCQTPEPTPEDLTKNVPVVVKKAELTKQDEARFLRAIRDDDINQVHFFISVGADLNKNYKFPGQEAETPLYTAIEARSRNSVRLLLDSGARPDVWENPNNSELIAAILSRQELVALELIDKGAQFDKVLKENGETALMSAARVGMCSVVKQLVDRGSKINMQNREGYTALMYAAEYGHKSIKSNLKFG